MPIAYASSSKRRFCRGSRPERTNPAPDPLREQAFGEALDADKLERFGHEVHLDRKLERMLAMLLRLKDLRQGAIEG